MFRDGGFGLIPGPVMTLQAGCGHLRYNGSGSWICHGSSGSGARPGHGPEGGVCGGGQRLWVLWHGGGDHVQVAALCTAHSV